ncbi:MAG: septum site-determining protein MinD [Clostridia bacterium]|nr:septum site-determining protein MinD [Clostridia bacterium]
MGKTIIVCSGKGGTGKTMFAANLGAMLAKRENRVCLIDMDTGLRNLDLYLGLENNVVYDVSDVLSGVCRIKQALIKHKSFPGLYFMAASPRPDEGEFTPLHMQVLCSKLSKKFDYVIVDCPAGLDDGLQIATGGADQVIMIITPEYSSIRDAEAVTANLMDQKISKIHYVLNKVNVDLVKLGFELSLEDLPEVIRRRLIGIVKDDVNIHISTNLGMPAVFQPDTYIYHNFYKIAGRVMDL